MTRTVDSLTSRRNWLSVIGFTLGCVWPGANFVANNASEFAWMDRSALAVVAVLTIGLWFAGLAFSMLPSLLSIRWSIPRALTVATFGVFLLFGQRVFRAWFLTTLSESGLAANAAYLAAVVGLAFLCWHVSRYQPIRFIVAFFSIFLSLFPVTRLVLTSIERVREAASTDATPLEAQLAGPLPALSGRNVYYVILDGYAGSQVLKRDLGFSIEPFLQSMRAMGFVSIEGARSNYTTTFLAIMAVLRADYLLDEHSPRFTDRREFFPQALRAGPLPPVIARLRAGGYDFFHVGSQWVPCRAREGVRCLSSASSSRFFEYVGGMFLAPTGIPLERLGVVEREPAGALESLAVSVDDLRQGPRPYLALVHELTPHPPYRRADCSPSPTPEGLHGRRDDIGKQQYIRSIQCLNDEIEDHTRRLLALDPEAIVVFQADHGSDFKVDFDLPLADWSAGAIEERTSIINLVRLPDICRQDLRPRLSPINTIRLVMSCLEGRRPDYLPDHAFISSYEANDDFGIVRDVTGLLVREQTQAPH